MKFLLVVCVAVVSAQYAEVKPDTDYPPAPPPDVPEVPEVYPAPRPLPMPILPVPAPGSYYPPIQVPVVPGIPSYPPYQDNDRDYHRDEFRKLRDLKADRVFEANVRYFRRNGHHFAGISCPRNSSIPISLNFAYLLADSHRSNSPSPFPKDTVALAGGINFEYVAKYENNKWEGYDFGSDEKQRFRKVACFLFDSNFRYSYFDGNIDRS